MKMNKQEFLSILNGELEKHHVADAAEIVYEYEQHFAFKLADGFSEEEISVKLGDPAALALQYERDDGVTASRGKKLTSMIGLVFADIIAALGAIVLTAWAVVMALFSLACALLAVNLLARMNAFGLIPSMPYGCAVIFGISFLALAVLSFAGFTYYAAFLRQLFRSYARFHYNTKALASDKPTLPALTVSPRFSAKTKRRLRLLITVSLLVFVISFGLAFIFCSILAGELQFWHTWGWFGQTVG